MKSISIAIILILLSPSFASVKAQQTAQATPKSERRELVYYARQLQEHISAENTAYRHKDNVVEWGENGKPWECYADCSGFINALLAHSFDLTPADFERLWGHHRMYAYHYFDAIKAGTHFRQIHNIRDIRPGDLISLEYPDRAEHDDNTGHIMVVDGDPQPHRPSKVIAPNTLQYVVAIIDCSRSGHGSTDTRSQGGTSFYAGLGKGELRLYTNLSGDITGYSWSTGNPKPGFNPLDTPILIGRIDL